MRYHQPRQIESGPNAGRWHYTVRIDGDIYPEGYCSRWRVCPACDGHAFLDAQGDRCETCGNRGSIEVTDPCPGHDTPQGAYRHQTEWVLDHHLDLRGGRPDTQHPCRVCGEWTTRFAAVAGEEKTYPLCDAHRTREHVAGLFGQVGDSLGSY